MRKYCIQNFVAAFLLPMAVLGAPHLSSSNSNMMQSSFSQTANKDTINWSKQKTAPWFVDRFQIGAGFFAAQTTTDIKLGKSSGGSIGSDIDFEKDLGFKREVQTFMANFQWRISRRWRMDFSYYQLNRSSAKTLERTINFGDHTYNVSATVSSYFNNSIYRASLGYAILSKPTAELGLLIGAHTLQSSIGVGLTAGGAGVAYNDNYNFTAPLPDFGLWGGIALSKRLALNGEFDYLSIAAGQFKGEIVGYNASLTFKALKQLDLALGYTGFNFKIDANTNNQNAHLGWGYHGPSLTANFRFGRNNWKH
jgi:hypothetical protein